MNDHNTLLYITFIIELQNAGHKFGCTHCVMGKICSDALHILHLPFEGFENISNWLLRWSDMSLVSKLNLILFNIEIINWNY